MAVTDESSASSSSSFGRTKSHASGDIARIQQWIDHSDWDAFDERFPPNDDVAICERALKSGVILPLLPERTGSSESTDSSESMIHSPAAAEIAADRFRNPKLLGEGGFGVVFAADDSRLGIPVALKFLRPSHHNSREHRSRFLSEAQMIASLSHPGIIRVFDVVRIDNLLLISSARIEAGSLAKWLAHYKRAFAPRQAAWMVHKLAEAVSCAHSVGMLHRDLKPGNVLLEPCPENESEGLAFRPILTDFGLAKRLQKSGDQTNWSIQGQPIGTTRYMSPEQAAGDGAQVSSVSDVFALGIILYELALGQVPFDGPTPHAIRQAIIEGSLIRPRQHNPKFPADLEAIILKSLRSNPGDRYQTMREFGLDLQRFLDDEPVQARKSTLLRRTGYLVRKHPVTATATFATIAMNLVALIGLGISVRNGNRAIEIEQKATKQVEASLKKEQAAFERYIASEESRRHVLRDVVTLYSDVTDDIIAGKKIGVAELVPSLEKTASALQNFVNENPDDMQSLHRLNVVQHYLSMGYNNQNELEKAIISRASAIQAIEQLLVLQPDNLKYRFDRFMSYLILGQLKSVEESRSKKEQSEAKRYLEIARSQIDELCRIDPNNLAYLEGRLEVKRLLAQILPISSIDNRISLEEEIVLEATKLSKEYPDRESFNGIAINTGMDLARQYLARGENEKATMIGLEAMTLFDQTRRPIPDEVSRLDHALGNLVIWYEVLGATGHPEQALKIAEDANWVNTLLLKYKTHTPYYSTNLSTYLFRIRVARTLGRTEEHAAIVGALTEFVKMSRGNLAAHECIQEILQSLENDPEIAPEVRGCLEALEQNAN